MSALAGQGKLAIAEYNALAEPTVLRSLDSEGLARKKHAVMRELNWAAQIGENYFQAAWYNLAEDTGKSAVETDINLVRPKFQSALQVYQVVQMAASQLVYDQDARYASVPQAPATQQEGPEVVLVVNVVGEWASVGVVTFWSILKHRSTPLRVFIFGDQPGIRDWRRVMREMQLAVPHLMHRLRFSYVDIFHHPRMASYFSRLPPQCASTNMSKALFARLLCHELLPKEVDRAIAIDLGDILVFEDILGLWQEGDKLLPEEVLAAASHRSVEETLRHTKPTNLNGGVVLYEVSRMRSSGYTEDTLRAAQIGLAKGYDRFCVWDQDIINALQQDVWGNRGVRVLPCRWSLFPITGWQFFWNTPGYWLEELVQLRRYPGFLAVDHFEHFCPDAILMLHTVFAFASRRDRKLARDVALAQGLRNEQPGSAILSPEGSPCPCREKAALLHVPSTMKLWPWVQELFRHHSPPFLAPADSAALFRSRTEQGEEVGGGFWGSEGREDLESMQQGTLRWAMTAGASVVAGSCATLPTASGHYVRAELPALSDSSQLTVTAETNATEDAHLFIGKITTVPDHIHAMGVVDTFQSSRTVLRWGMRGEELASHQGRVLQEGAWSKFWMQARAGSMNSSGLWAKARKEIPEEETLWSPASPRVQILGLLLLACIANQACRALPFYLVDFAPNAQASQAMNQDLAFSSADYGFFATLGFTIPFTLASLWAGVAADSADRFRLTAVAGVGWSICTAGMALSSSYGSLLLSRALLGLSQAATNPAALSLIAELFPDARATANAIFGLGIYLGGAIASLGAYVDEQEGWRTTCVLFGVASVAASLPVLSKQDAHKNETVSLPSLPANFGEMQRQIAKLPEAASEVLTSSLQAVEPSGARWLLLGSTLRFSAGFAILVWLPSAVRATFPEDIEQFAVINSLIKGLAGGISSVGGGLAADALRSRGFGDKAAAYFCAASSLLAAPLWYLTLADGFGFESSMTFLCVEYLVAESWLGPAISALQGSVDPKRRGAAQGVFSSLTALGNGLPVVLGLLAPAELTEGLQVSVAVCYVLSGICFLCASRHLSQETSS
ncbi:unnamed protein product [Effrenium voratum]|nr:unnamed protein product [Effrenium voratum]